MALPIAAKMPAPMMAPSPSDVSCTGPSERLSPPPFSPSAIHWSTVLRANSPRIRISGTHVSTRVHAGCVRRIEWLVLQRHFKLGGDGPAIPSARRVEEIPHHLVVHVPTARRALRLRIDGHLRDLSLGGHPEVHDESAARAVCRQRHGPGIGLPNVRP